MYIQSYVKIKDFKIWLKGKLSYEHRDITIDFADSAYKALCAPYPKFYKMDSLSKMGIICADLLLDTFQLFPNEYLRGLVLTNRSSSLHTDKEYAATMASHPSPALFVYTLPNIVLGEISIKHKFKGENIFFIRESFDAAFLHHYASYLFENNLIENLIIGYLEIESEYQDAMLFFLSKAPTDLYFDIKTIEEIYKSDNR